MTDAEAGALFDELIKRHDVALGRLHQTAEALVICGVVLAAAGIGTGVVAITNGYSAAGWTVLVSSVVTALGMNMFGYWALAFVAARNLDSFERLWRRTR